MPAARAGQGQIAEVILAETALYAESGGQVADKGVIVGPGYELEVLAYTLLLTARYPRLVPAGSPRSRASDLPAA